MVFPKGEGERDRTQNVELPVCGYESQSMDFPYSFQVELEAFLRRVQRLDRLHSLNLFGPRALRLEIHLEAPFLVKLDEQGLHLGWEVATTEGVFESLVVQSLLFDSMKKSFRSSLVGDLFSVLVRGTLEFQGVTSKETVDYGKIDIGSQSLHDFVSYCHSATRSIWHLDYCMEQNSWQGPMNGLPGSFSPESLRPFLVRQLFDHWRDQVALEPLYMKKRWLMKLMKGPALPIDEVYQVKPTDALDVAVQETLKQLGVSLSVQKKNDPIKTKGVDVLVDWQASSPPSDMGEALVKRDFDVLSRAVLWKGQTLLRPFHLANWQAENHSLKAGVIVVVSCLKLSPEELLAYESQSSRLVHVTHCKGDPAIHWTYLGQSVERFLRYNTHLPFVEFYLPSLRLAWEQTQKHQLKSHPPSSADFWREPQWRQIVGWTGQQKLDRASYMRDLSQLDAVVRFRDRQVQ